MESGDRSQPRLQDLNFGRINEFVRGQRVIRAQQVFRRPDFDVVKKLMRTPVVFDGRNIYEPKAMAALGFTYYGIGR